MFIMCHLLDYIFFFIIYTFIKKTLQRSLDHFNYMTSNYLTNILYYSIHARLQHVKKKSQNIEITNIILSCQFNKYRRETSQNLTLEYHVSDKKTPNGGSTRSAS